jgi:diguanylate cyclase (GGDEF)-like protein
MLELAFYDPLTNLPNRRLLHDRLHQAIASSARTGQFGAILLLDLDHFKTINDTRGHQVGDRLLVDIAQRLRNNLREADTAARPGGDEFIVLLEGLGQDEIHAAAGAEASAEKLRELLSEPYDILDDQYHVGLSIGITLFDHATDGVDALLKQVDLALYDAKDAGRNTIRFYNANLQDAVEARAQLEAGLHRALRDHELVLYYQPQVDDNGTLFGVEALLRWQPPGQPMVSPADFIPVAEESGLILPIGSWVLRTACDQVASWATNPATQHIQVAINISAKQFREPGFVDEVRNTLTESGADPRRVKLELTESSVVDNLEEVIAKMQAIKQLGVSFSMDDFGTGYSSLAYLKRLPLGQLKIDQSFVRNIPTDADDCAIARAVIALGQSLHLNVIAEGVETDAQREYLSSHGCIAYQGFLYGRPGPAGKIEDMAKLGWEKEHSD